MLYAYLNYETLRSKLVVVLVSADPVVLLNTLRIFIVVYLAYTTISIAGEWSVADTDEDDWMPQY